MEDQLEGATGVPISPIPNEIIAEILSYLGRNDLLKCRLVNKSWNELALKILRNSGHAHELTEDNIQEFIEFSNERNNEKWILPFLLNFKCVLEDSKVYPEIPSYILQLQGLFGKYCVVGLTLSHHSSSLESVKILISILTPIAYSMTYLDLSEFRLRYQAVDADRKKVEEMIGKGHQVLDFPNLLKLKSCPPPNYVDEDGDIAYDENKILCYLVAQSDYLEELELGMTSSDDFLGMDEIPSLKKLTILKVIELDIYELDGFEFPALPVLNDLTLSYSTELSEFLSKTMSFSTSLKRLNIIFEEIPTNPLPRLSDLRSLQIQVSTPTKVRMPVDPEKLNLNSEAFPVLESLDISTNINFEYTDANSPNPKDHSIMPTVNNLSIRVTDSSFDASKNDQNEHEDAELFSKASAKDYVDLLQQLFPNVTSLTLVNESDGHEEYLNELRIAFIQSDGAPRIQELKIQECKKNNLGHILNGFKFIPRFTNGDNQVSQEWKLWLQQIADLQNLRSHGVTVSTQDSESFKDCRT